MKFILDFFTVFDGFVWGPVMLVLLVGGALFLSIGTKLIQYRKLGKAFRTMRDKGDQAGDVSPFAALMAAMSATVGTGNIVGVATAVAMGGPGAVFWMWLLAILGGATKFSEAVLAVKFRITNDRGERAGGPMYYCSRGMESQYGGNWKWFGWLFALFGGIACFGIGNLTQINAITANLESAFSFDKYFCAIVVAILIGAVIIGGIKRIARVAEFLVPIMAIIYVVAALIVLFSHASHIPAAFGLIFSHAFDGSSVVGGLFGGVIRYGLARGVFSSEAGLGSAPMAHAASSTNDPVKQGLLAALEPLIDTLIICSMTALVCIMSGYLNFGGEGGMLQTDYTGDILTQKSFDKAIPFGSVVVAISLTFFAFSTNISWYYYGSKCWEYIIGHTKFILFFQILWVVVCFVGGISKLDVVWLIADTFNGLMAFPNLIALLALSPLIFKTVRDFDAKEKGAELESKQQG